MKIALASDHAGFPLKQHVIELLEKLGHKYTDFGCRSEASADVSDHVEPAAVAVAEGKVDRGVFIDGAGYPSGVVANMVHGVYAAVCHDLTGARLSREHGGCNVLCLGAMLTGQLTATQMIEAFLTTNPLGGKYEARRNKVEELSVKHRRLPTDKIRQIIAPDDIKRALEKKESLLLNEKTVLTPGVLDLAASIKG